IATLNIHWKFLLTFTATSIVGIFIGIKLNTYINGRKLKKGFGWFVLLMGTYIIFKEFSN
ncbi:MAG TPA: TSUP family transporter, partial [Aequorivita sp.]|nr:TSUP family transporter [Aequorivita sp.]